jgi:hypothetical protein
MTPDEIIQAAADHIEKHGWVQGYELNRTTQAACAYGALHAGAGWTEWEKGIVGATAGDELWVVDHSLDMQKAEEILEAARVLAGFLQDQGLIANDSCAPTAAPVNIQGWNDDQYRTEEEVVETLRNAATKYRMK